MRGVSRKIFSGKGKYIIALLLAVLITAIACITGVYGKQGIENKSNSIQRFPEENLKASSEDAIYIIKDNRYVTRILPETTLKDLKNNLDNQELEVYDKNNNKLSENQKVGTSMLLIMSGNEYRLSVLGDLVGDGLITITDVVRMQRDFVSNANNTKDEYFYAKNIINDNDINLSDVVRVNLSLLKIIDLVAPRTFIPQATATKTAITVSGETTDFDKNNNIKQYWFEINNNGWVQNSNPVQNEYTFNGLQSGTEYTVRMKVEDKSGNQKITQRVAIKTLEAEEIEEVGLETTPNSVVITIPEEYRQTDAEYEYIIEVNGQKVTHKTTETSHTFENVSSGEYKVEVIIRDRNGNVQGSKKIDNVKVPTVDEYIEDKELQEVTIIPNKISDNTVRVTLTYPEIDGYIPEIKIGDGNWQRYTGPVEVNKNTTVLARLRNVNNSNDTSEEKQIEITDILKPEIVPEATPNSVTITIPEEYRKPNATYEYVLIVDGQEFKHETTEISYTFEDVPSGNHRVKVIVKNQNEIVEEKQIEVKIPTIDEYIEKDEIEDITISTNVPEGTYTNGKVRVTLSYPQIEGYIPEIKIGNGNWQEYTGPIEVDRNVKVTARLRNSKNNNDTSEEKQIQINNIDTENPDPFTITTESKPNSVKVNVNTDSTEEGIEYEYTIEVNGVKRTPVKTTEKTHTFENIPQGSDVKVVVVAKDSAGNETRPTGENGQEYAEGEGKQIKLPTIDEYIVSNNLGKITLEADPGENEWTNNEVTVTITYPEIEGYIKEFKIGDSRWQGYSAPIKVTNNSIVQARLKYSKDMSQTTEAEQIEINNIDKDKPNALSITARQSVGGVTVTVTTAEDALSGINNFTYKLKEINSTFGFEKTTDKTTWEFTSVTRGKTYQVEVIARDNAGNEKSITTQVRIPDYNDITINANPGKNTWTNSCVEVTVTYPNIEGTRKFISIGKTGENGEEIFEDCTEEAGENPEITRLIYENTIIKAKLVKEGETAAYKSASYSINNIDTVTPVIESITVQSTATTITVNSVVRDEGGSGLAGCVYRIDGGDWKTSNTFEGLIPGTKYSVQIMVVDNARNDAQSEPIEVSTKVRRTLTIDPKGGIYNGQTEIIGDEGETVPLESIKRTGYGFNGWNKIGAGTVNEDSTFTFGNSDTKLEAQWIEGLYTVTLNPDGGQVTPTYVTGRYNQRVDIPNPTKEYTVSYKNISTDGEETEIGNDIVSYDFKGWLRTEGQGSVDNENKKFTFAEDNATLKAQWTSKSVTLPNAEREYNDFKGWYTDKEFINFVGIAGQQYSVTSDINLYPKFEVRKHALTTNLNDSTRPNVEQYSEGIGIDISTPERTGYTFTGWTITPEDAGTIVDNVFFGTKDATITANWQAEVYTISLEEQATKLYVQYDKAGIYTDQECSTLATSAITKPTKSYTLNYNTNGGTLEQTSQSVNLDFDGYYAENTDGSQNIIINKDGNINAESVANNYFTSDVTLKVKWALEVELPEPTRAHYAFLEWYKDESLSDESCVGEAGDKLTDSNITQLYAKWASCNMFANVYTDGTCIISSTSEQNINDLINEGYLENGSRLKRSCAQATYGKIDLHKSGLSDIDDVTKVVILDKVYPETTNRLFSGGDFITEFVNIENIDTRNVTSMQEMFRWCRLITSLDLHTFDTSKVTSMNYMFEQCDNLTYVNIENWDASKVESMMSMFGDCPKLTNINMRGVKTLDLTSTMHMFINCSRLTSVDLSGFVGINIETMYGMFSNCSSLREIDLSNLRASNLQNMSYAFSNCANLTTVNLGGKFKPINLVNLSNAFANCTSLKEIDLSFVNSVHITTISKMFYNCTSLKEIDFTVVTIGFNCGTTGFLEGCTNLEKVYIHRSQENSNVNATVMGCIGKFQYV